MNSYETLKKRYTDEEFITSAAARRNSLEYEKITFGKNLSPRKKYILLLLKDTHAAFLGRNTKRFSHTIENKKTALSMLCARKGTAIKSFWKSPYIGNYPAVIAMCGMMLESVLLLKVRTHFEITKFIEYTRKPNGPVLAARTIEEIEELQFADLIGVCHHYNYLSNDLFQQLRNIHKIRNITIHDKMPFFKRVDNDYVLELPGAKFPVVLSRESVKLLIADTSSLAAYFCLTRSRLILSVVIESFE